MNNRIKKLREILNLTLEIFGERIGVTDSVMKRIEKDKHSITDQIVLTICHEFGVDEHWLKTGEGTMLKIITNDDLELLTQKHNLTHLERLILEKYLDLSIPERAVIADFITKEQKQS